MLSHCGLGEVLGADPFTWLMVELWCMGSAVVAGSYSLSEIGKSGELGEVGGRGFAGVTWHVGVWWSSCQGDLACRRLVVVVVVVFF